MKIEVGDTVMVPATVIDHSDGNVTLEVPTGLVYNKTFQLIYEIDEISAWNARAGGLEWTENKPTIDGLYWVRTANAKKPDLVAISDPDLYDEDDEDYNPLDRLVTRPGCECWTHSIDPLYEGAKWYGPIAPPTEASK